ncbi:MAG: EpsG family protein [Duncaniella sp.]|nr:EpsG family protein [Duncaniella sp.]
MNPSLYEPIYLTIVAMLALAFGIKLMSTGGNTLAIGEENKGHFLFPLVLAICFAIWIGLRPVSFVFGDTVNYARIYWNLNEYTTSEVNWSGEWVWSMLTVGCNNLGFSVNTYFLIVELGYVLSAVWAAKKFVPTSPYLGTLFLFSSLMFFTFGVNGLRNGLACHILLLAMAFMMEDKRVIAFVLAFLAIGIHKSVMLPIAAVIAAMTVIREPRQAFYIWLASIALSLLWGEQLTGFISTIGIDDRMSHYTTLTDIDYKFSQRGFRWDFLLYSAMPVWMIWYVNVKKGLRDGWFNIISITYLLANSFWIIVIRAAFSNRFAYLSWFLYPIVIVYPLCNMRAWENQDRIAGQILLAYCGFSIFMLTFFW